MSDEEVLSTTADGVATITLNRRDRFNAFTFQGAQRMRACFESAANDSSVGVSWYRRGRASATPPRRPPIWAG